MACGSLIQFLKECSSAGSMGGVKKLYMLAYADLDTSAGAGYATATNGLVNAITLDSAKKFVEVGALKNSISFSSKSTIDPTKGVNFSTNTMNAVLGGMSIEVEAFLDSVLNQDVVALVQDKNDNYRVVGLNGGFRLESYEGGTGSVETDLSGYTLVFSGADKNRSMNVDSTIVNALLA